MKFSAALTPALHSHLAVLAAAQFANSMCISCVFCRATINQAEIYIKKERKRTGWLQVHSVCPDTHRSSWQSFHTLPIISQVAIGLFKLALAQHRSRWQKCNQRCLTTLQGCQWKLWHAHGKLPQSGPLPSCFADKCPLLCPDVVTPIIDLGSNQCFNQAAAFVVVHKEAKGHTRVKVLNIVLFIQLRAIFSY